MRHTAFLLIVIAAIAVLCLSACDEPVYQDQGTAEAPPAPQTQEQVQDEETERRAATSTYGKAMDAGRRTAERLEEHDQRIQEELPDY